MSEWDFIIVGGGSAGCAAANRLSADTNNRVLLLEAGGTHHSALIEIPFMTLFTMPTWLKNWHYKTEPQQALNQRRGYQPRGRALGGSSAINAMIYIRGQKEDYDHWSSLGHDEWSWDKVLPLYKSFEHNHDIHDHWHGQDGELSVSNLTIPNPCSYKFIEAAKALGHPYNPDFNGAQQLGVGLYQVTQKQGQRHTAAHAFIDPVAHRSNLTVQTHSRALRLLMDGKHCVGVEYQHEGKIYKAKANRQVILSAGAMATPQLLMLSGIGDADELKKHDIECIHHLPGVGANFHDHPDYVFNYRSSDPDLLGFSPSRLLKMWQSFRQYRKTHEGLMASNFAEAGAFLATDGSTRPDIQLHFVIGIVDAHCHKPHIMRGMSCHVCVLRPKSRGHIKLQSNNPFKAPLIDPAFLTHEDDIRVLMDGYKITRDIMEHSVFDPHRRENLYPANTDDEILARLRQRTDTVYHPVGSCKMGDDDMAVVNQYLKVHGLEGLTIADASIMPEVISGNTNAPCMMIGLKAAEFLMR